MDDPEEWGLTKTKVKKKHERLPIAALKNLGVSDCLKISIKKG